MKYSEVCPHCDSSEYEINDYGDDFDQFGAEQWWECTCAKCGTKFQMIKLYKLTEVIIEKSELA